MTGGPERKRFIEEYKTEKKGFHGQEDLGPNTDLLRAVGIEMPRPAPTYIMAAAARSRTSCLDADALKDFQTWRAEARDRRRIRVVPRTALEC
eukprot:3183615-Pyramimonas_sp.AAC.1